MVFMGGKGKNNGSRTNQVTHFGIMGGLAPSTNISQGTRMFRLKRARNQQVIPLRASPGLEYMREKNILSKNPLGSGGVGLTNVLVNRSMGPCNCGSREERGGKRYEEDDQMALAPGYGNLQSLPNAVILFPAFVPLSELLKDKPGKKRTFVIAFAAPFSGTTEVAMVATTSSIGSGGVDYTLPDDTPLNLSQSIPCLDNRLVDCPRNTFTLINSEAAGPGLTTSTRVRLYGAASSFFSLQQTILNIRSQHIISQQHDLTYRVPPPDPGPPVPGVTRADPSSYCLPMEPAR